MKKKTKKKLIVFGISCLVIVLVTMIIINFGVSNQSVISIRTYEDTSWIAPQIGTLNFAEIEGTYETVKLGCYTSGSDKSDNGIYYINSNDDGDISFCNSIESSSTLKLLSSISTSDPIETLSNYIQYKITLPAGNLKIDYNYDIANHQSDTGRVTFSFDNTTLQFEGGYGPGKDHSNSGSGTYEIELTETKEIIFRIEPTVDEAPDHSMGKLEIEFTPTPQPIIYYRIDKNQCIEVQLFAPSTDDNNYNSLEECQAHLKHFNWLLWISISIIALLILIGTVLIIKRK